MSEHLRVDPILCDAYGHCAELLPELIQLDEWGYPIVDGRPIPQELARDTRPAVSSCPRLALFIEQIADVEPSGGSEAAGVLRLAGAENTGRTQGA